MKTLEQWQKELPGFTFWKGESGFLEIAQFGSVDALFYEHNGCECWCCVAGQVNEEKYVLWRGERISLKALIAAGATFRRKKERQREFKIEFGNGYQRVMIDGETMCLCQLHRSGKFPAGTSATLTVNEWGGE